MRRDRREPAAIFAGGFPGAVGRALLVEWLPHDRAEWPWPTFVANIAGAFPLGYFVTRLQERLPLSACWWERSWGKTPSDLPGPASWVRTRRSAPGRWSRIASGRTVNGRSD